MSSIINKESLEHLAKLARIKLNAEEETKLLKDLQKILGYFEEMKKIKTEDIEPLTGGTMIKNSFRKDEECENTNQGKGVGDFPENQDGFLKVPPVFE